MSRGGKACRDCGAEITFIEGRNGRWIPVTPGTEDRHRCELDQVCDACHETFKGAPWMDLCPGCYKNGGKPPESTPAATSAPGTRETLQDDPRDDNDAPPF